MSPDTPSTSARPVASGTRAAPWRAFAQRGLLTVAASLGLALLLSLTGRPSKLAVNATYSMLIGLCCWLLIDGGMQTLDRLQTWITRRAGGGAAPTAAWGWRSTLLIVPLGAWLGYLAGSSAADRLTGFSSPKPLLDGTGGGALTIPLMMAIGITGLMFARERLAVHREQAAAAERLAAETRLALLQSQLEPHMLFNTLANLRVLIALDPPRAQAMLDRLIAFLRATLSASRSGAHPLASEFERVADYLALIGVRMGARLQVTLDLPPALRALPVPPLLLQPLVENAVQHGLEPKVAGGRIEVRARRDGAQLVLSVRDTGLGLGAAPPSQGTRFGLQQVRQRLQVLHGDAATLTLQVADDAEGGTLALLRLPLDGAAVPTPATQAPEPAP